jgi:hypothetical protein
MKVKLEKESEEGRYRLSIYIAAVRKFGPAFSLPLDFISPCAIIRILSSDFAYKLLLK